MADRSDTSTSNKASVVVNSEESIFLEEIAAAPRSVDRRLIYADWLEEHADPRGEFIQQWHLLDSFRPWTVEFGDCSRRIRQLRDSISAEWLKRLEYSATYRPMLAEIPRDRQSRWQLLANFLEVWHRALNAADAISETIVRAREPLMKQRLPAALVEWYCHSGYADDIWRCGTSFPGGLLAEHSGLWLYQHRLPLGGVPGGASEYLLRESDLGMDDPPVYCGTSELVFTGLSVSEFAIYRALATTVCASPATPGWSARVASPSRYVPTDFNATGLPKMTTTDGETCFHESADALVEVRAHGLCMTALNADAVSTILEYIPTGGVRLRVDGKWEETQDERRFVRGISDPNLLEG